MRRQERGIVAVGHARAVEPVSILSDNAANNGAEPTIATTTAYRGPLVGVRLDTVTLPDGREHTREIVEHPSSACIVPLDGEGNVLMVRQFRKAVESFLLEAPAGKLEPDEDPEVAAARELQEETGYRAGKLRPLGTFFTAPGWCTQSLHAFLATELEPSRLDADDDEFIETALVPLAEIPDRIASGEIRDAKSVASLLLAIRVLGDN